MATLITSLLLIWAVLGFGSNAAIMNVGGGKHHDGSEVVDVDTRPDVSNRLQDVLGKAHKGLYDYPTSFTQGIIPVSWILNCSVSRTF